jgi:hypothetical protein
MSSMLPIIISSLLSEFYRITNRKWRSLTPYSKLRRAYTWTSLRELIWDNGSFTSAKILLSTKHAWNKEGVAWSQKWLPYHLSEWYSGVTNVRRQRQNESNQTLGNSPRRWRRARAYIDITHTLELEHDSLYLSLNTSSSRPLFTRSWANIHLWPNIANFFLSVQRSIVQHLLFYLWILLFTSKSESNFVIIVSTWAHRKCRAFLLCRNCEQVLAGSQPTAAGGSRMLVASRIADKSHRGLTPFSRRPVCHASVAIYAGLSWTNVFFNSLNKKVTISSADC